MAFFRWCFRFFQYERRCHDCKGSGRRSGRRLGWRTDEGSCKPCDGTGKVWI